MDKNELHHKFKEVYVALVHGPVLDRAGNKVCTSVTNFDIHDIARACKTYGVNQYFIINQMQEQLMFVDRVINHWKTGYGKQHNPMRCKALHHVQTVETIEDSIKIIGEDVLVVATAARQLKSLENITFGGLRSQMESNPARKLFLLFGTGFGLHEEALKHCQLLLEPISGGALDEYKHLSVRSAVSICLDRLLSAW